MVRETMTQIMIVWLNMLLKCVLHAEKITSIVQVSEQHSEQEIEHY